MWRVSRRNHQSRSPQLQSSLPEAIMINVGSGLTWIRLNKERAMKRALLCFVLAAVGPSVAHAQAWTPEAKTLSFDGSYQFGYATKTENVDVKVQHHIFIPEVEYGITDSLALTASMPIMATKADGGNPHGSWDDSAYHETPTDLRVTARYMIPVGILAITPHLGASTPVRTYETHGNAAAGRGLKALYAGLSLGLDLDEEIPRTALQVSYEFALVERYKDAGPEAAGRDQNNSAVTAQVVHTLGDFQLSAGVDFHQYHGGITFAEFGSLTMDERTNHDLILKERILLVGGGVAYNIGEHAKIFATARVFATGENTTNASLFALGGSWDIGL
jgi:opacity protein-like surface antigen